MPLVVVNRNPKVLTDELLKTLVASLPESVASTLTCSDSGGDLTAKDIEVWVQDFGPYDINTKDVEIIVWANLYPKRLKNLEFREKNTSHPYKICTSRKNKRFCLDSLTTRRFWRILTSNIKPLGKTRWLFILNPKGQFLTVQPLRPSKPRRRKIRF